MEDVTIYESFPREWLVGPECERILREVCTKAEELYSAEVAKRTAELAHSPHITVDIEGDRFVGMMTIGDAEAPYAASHEFGTGRRDPRHALPAAHDLRAVLDQLAAQ